MLVGADGQTLYEDHNRVTDDDRRCMRSGRHPVGGREYGSGATYSRHRVHLVRALPDVRGRARLGGAGPHRLRDVERAADRVADRMGHAGAAGGHAAGHDRRARAVVDGPAPELAEEMKALYEASSGDERAGLGRARDLVAGLSARLRRRLSRPTPPPQPGEHRLRRIVGWFDHAIELGASGIALGPMFASRTHGYDTTDHYRIDPRLGDDDDFDHLIAEARRRGLRVLLDGVFNHVGADFPRYREAVARRAAARWFRGRPGRFHTFEGHDGLITLNHDNPAVVDYIVDVMAHWLRRGADGWRLDAAYAVPHQFWAAVLPRVRQAHPDAWFVGEVIHGDYAAVVRDTGFDSVTQYELWKAIWSSLNDGNFFELDYALQRHNEFLDTFVPMTFIGNHDVTRIASQLDAPSTSRTRWCS